jgi:hypothetical protein
MLSPFPAVAKVSTYAVDPAVAVVQALVQKTKRLANYRTLTIELVIFSFYRTTRLSMLRPLIGHLSKYQAGNPPKLFGAKIRKLFICQSQQRGP